MLHLIADGMTWTERLAAFTLPEKLLVCIEVRFGFLFTDPYAALRALAAVIKEYMSA